MDIFIMDDVGSLPANLMSYNIDAFDKPPLFKRVKDKYHQSFSSSRPVEQQPNRYVDFSGRVYENQTMAWDSTHTPTTTPTRLQRGSSTKKQSLQSSTAAPATVTAAFTGSAPIPISHSQLSAKFCSTLNRQSNMNLYSVSPARVSSSISAVERRRVGLQHEPKKLGGSSAFLGTSPSSFFGPASLPNNNDDRLQPPPPPPPAVEGISMKVKTAPFSVDIEDKEFNNTFEKVVQNFNESITLNDFIVQTKNEPKNDSNYFQQKIREIDFRLQALGTNARNKVIQVLEKLYSLSHSKAALSRAVTSVSITLDMQMNLDAILASIFVDEHVSDRNVEQAIGKDSFKLLAEVREILKLIDKVPDIPENLNALRNLVIAMATDFRSISIVIGHVAMKWRIMSSSSVDHQHTNKDKLAQRILSIYAPLANRLGIWRTQTELEEYAFQHLFPEQCQQLREMVGSRLEASAFALQKAKENIEDMICADSNITDHIASVRVRGRTKGLYSIFKKLQRSGSSIDEIYDILALRVVITPKEDCNEAQEANICHKMANIVKATFDSSPVKVKDYVTNPKPNGYQSLHLIGEAGEQGQRFPLEIQVRTARMHQFAEFGRAAHWMYKEESYTGIVNNNSRPSSDRLPLPHDEFSLGESDSLNIGKASQPDITEDIFSESPTFNSHEEYLSAVNRAIHKNQVIVIEKGRLHSLEAGSTLLDFAYKGLHLSPSDVDSSTSSKRLAMVNGISVPLTYKLAMKDIVRFEIL